MIKLSSLIPKEANLPENLEYPLAKGKDLQSYEGMEGWKGKLVWMPPEKFLRMTRKLLDVDKASYSNLKNRMIKGLPVDFLVLAVDMEKRKVVGHEGRHRATVAKELGIEKVPVLIYTGHGFKRVPQWEPADHDVVDKLAFKPEWDITEGVRLNHINQQLDSLRKEWDRLDSQGTGHTRQQQIGQEIIKLEKEKARWDKLRSSTK